MTASDHKPQSSQSALAFPAESERQIPIGSTATWTSFAAGALTPFTISVGGQLPVGEIVLATVAGTAILCAFFNRAWPSELLRDKFLWLLLAAQFVSLCGYIFSDLYRHSAPQDFVRGWSRMIFLAIDIVAVVYLFGRSPRNLTAFVGGQCLGAVGSAVILGPLFDDMWKFGVGAPLTFFVLWLAPRVGSLTGALAAAGLGVGHFILDYRSMGALCLLVCVLTLLQARIHKEARLWLAPLGAAIAIIAVLWVYQHTAAKETGMRTTRSDVERSAMVTAAVEAIKKSPLIGYGSWFSNTDVYENFRLIRQIEAREANIGGFPQEYEDPGTTALHSQLLVALAEGGLFGGIFFLLFGAGLLGCTFKLIFYEDWHPFAPVCTLLLLSALWNLFFSPFSGAQRVYIAQACGLMLLFKAGSLFPEPEEPEA